MGNSRTFIRDCDVLPDLDECLVKIATNPAADMFPERTLLHARTPNGAAWVSYTGKRPTQVLKERFLRGRQGARYTGSRLVFSLKGEPRLVPLARKKKK